jgi:hypothetical protein
MMMEGLQVPSVLVVTKPFKSEAEHLLKERKFQDVPVHILPHPLETKPDAEVRAIADGQVASTLAKLQKPGTDQPSRDRTAGAATNPASAPDLSGREL